MSLSIEKTNFRGWPNSYRISNGTVEAIVTSDVGPRVMRYGFVGGQNFFKEFDAQMGKSGEAEWQPRGGHRVWIAPEDPVRSYAPDNDAVDIAIDSGVLTATQPVEPLTGLEKQITVKMEAAGTAVEVIHRIKNADVSSCDIAPWVLTMMAQGGAGIHGFPPRGTHPEMLAPANPLVMWAFTNLADPRWRVLQKYLVLLQDPKNSVPQKLGSFNCHTWGCYLLNGEVFMKQTRAEADPALYPDLGCSFETFTNADFLELETLGPLATLRPGDSVTHTERWSLHRGITVAEWTDAALDSVILPIVGGA